MGAVIVCCSTVDTDADAAGVDAGSPRSCLSMAEKLSASVPTFVREMSGMTRVPTR